MADAAHQLESLKRDREAPIWTIKCTCGWGTSSLSEQDALDRFEGHKGA